MNRKRWARAGCAFWLAVVSGAAVVVGMTQAWTPAAQLAAAWVGCGAALATAAAVGAVLITRVINATSIKVTCTGPTGTPKMHRIEDMIGGQDAAKSGC